MNIMNIILHVLLSVEDLRVDIDYLILKGTTILHTQYNTFNILWSRSYTRTSLSILTIIILCMLYDHF